MVADSLAEANLVPLQYGAMTYLNRQTGEPGIDQVGLAARLGVDRNNVGVILTELEARGLAERRQDPADQRARRLYLTAKGEKLYQQLQPRNSVANEQILAPLSARERELLLDLLVRVIQANAIYARPGAGRRTRRSRSHAKQQRVKPKLARTLKSSFTSSAGESVMPYRDMRDYLAALEQHDLLRRVTREVDRSWEIACLAKWMYQALPVERRFGLFCQNVTGSTIPVVTAALGASPRSVALALQCEVDEINDKVVAALRNPIKPRTALAGICQEVALRGEAASLARLPIVTWTPGKDKAPYITTIVITRNHDTGVQNMGVYRTMLRDDHSVVVNLSPGRQGTYNARTWTDRGKRAPIAWVIATEPAVHLATVANLPAGKDEIEFAGGLKGEPIELVRCKTIDLQVPTSTEIVIEGEDRAGRDGRGGTVRRVRRRHGPG